jgi:hypothetical protein
VQFSKVRCKTSQQGTLAFHARKLRKQGGVPPYKSWSYLMRNEQANETGGRVFYIDATGALFATPCSLLTLCKPGLSQN